MKIKPLLNFYLLNVIVQPLIGFNDKIFFDSKTVIKSTTTVVGRLYEDVIIPCSFKRGSNIVIHWMRDEKYLHSFFKQSDYLKNQDSIYENRTSLFSNEINNGNASLKLRRLNLQDEGVYQCYTSTTDNAECSNIDLKLGAFITPAIEYQEQDRADYLTCYLFGAYPSPTITWTENNTTNSESNTEVSSYPPFFVKSQLKITNSNSSYQCIIENSVLNQRWIGKWKRKDTNLTTDGKKISFLCELTNEDFSLEKNRNLSWYRVENASSTILASFSSSSSSMVFDNRFTWTKDMMHESRNFSLTLTHPIQSDSGKYLCNISSIDSTQLMIQFLTVEPLPEKSSSNQIVSITVAVIISLMIISIGILFKKKCNSHYRFVHANQEETQHESSFSETKDISKGSLKNSGIGGSEVAQ
ncbi:HERV-H LTR-associating protein 2 [Antechinus flavipes]|uniref:HERV-H LTR-associating protein 2 n=1 Tax=Antechinus flavipes TaxID=38775 RepID=UPI0022365281|nr:HERV-H LTR-associating protein 2 [Antechinus flavipes]